MVQDVFIVEAPTSIVEESLSRLLNPESGFRSIPTKWASLSADELSRRKRPLLVALGWPDPTTAIESLRVLSRTDGRILTLAVAPIDSSPETLCSIRALADDFMFWPVRDEEFLQRLRFLSSQADREVELACGNLIREFELRKMIGIAPAFVRLLQLITRFAPSEAPVLLTGETGTGKELCARSIHVLSQRHRGPFITVDCGAVPEHLADSELFGHVRGAFTDAHRDHAGLVSLAHGGTLFLDEIDALTIPMQGKLLRLIQEGSYHPLGSERFTRADVRVVAASNCNLESIVAAKQFRPDLYFRLNVLRLALPPLRERRSDIQLLAEYFLRQSARPEGRQSMLLSAAALRKLQEYDWPGNVRELFNVLQRAVVLCAGTQILPKHILLTGVDEAGDEEPAVSFHAARSQAIAAFERRYVSEMLQKHNGNITHAARDARHDRRGFGRLAKKYHLDLDSRLTT